MTDSLEKEIRQICTYYSELGEGTAGYNLSEEQFKKLFELMNEIQQKTVDYSVRTLINNHDDWYKEWKEGTWGDFVVSKIMSTLAKHDK
jgi:hypothetical protein